MTNYGKKLVFESTPGTGAYSDCTKWTIKYVWEGVSDPAMGRNIGWRDMMKNDLDDATRFAAEWERLWGQYTPPELSVFGRFFPKWRDKTMEEQEKQKQEETDRYFAWLGAKHALRLVIADFEVAQANARDARDALKEAKQLHTEAQARVDCQNRKLKLADELLVKATNVVDALAPISGCRLPEPPK